MIGLIVADVSIYYYEMGGEWWDTLKQVVYLLVLEDSVWRLECWSITFIPQHVEIYFLFWIFMIIISFIIFI